MHPNHQAFLAAHDETPIRDKDSAFGDVEIAETTPVPEDYYDHVYQHGRMYPSRYGMLSLDTCTGTDYVKIELERQEEQFHLLYRLFDARLQHTPAVDPVRVLDIGTGIGSWALEFGMWSDFSFHVPNHNSSLDIQVSGIDLIPIQTEWMPPNCEFLIDDFTTDDWICPYRGVEFIHIGWWNGNNEHARKFLKEIYRSCAHGGWVEITGISIDLFHGSRNNVFNHFITSLREAYERTNRSYDMPSSCLQELETQGFIKVVEHAYGIPLGCQHTNELHSEIIENWMAGFEAYAMETMIGAMDITELEVLLLCAAARKELRGKYHHGYLKSFAYNHLNCNVILRETKNADGSAKNIYLSTPDSDFFSFNIAHLFVFRFGNYGGYSNTPIDANKSDKAKQKSQCLKRGLQHGQGSVSNHSAAGSSIDSTEQLDEKQHQKKKPI